MEPSAGIPKFSSLEEPIRSLAALWRVLGSLPFSPSAPVPREGDRSRSLLARFATHR